MVWLKNGLLSNIKMGFAKDKGLKETQRMDCRFIFVLKGHYIEIKL